MLREPRRLIASIIAIAVGVAFAAATLFLSASLEKSLNNQIAGPAQGASLVVSAPTDNAASSSSSGTSSSFEAVSISPDLVTKLTNLPGVTKVHAEVEAYFEQKTSKGKITLVLRQMPDTDTKTKVVAGRLPKAKGEIAYAEAYAKARDVAVGSTVEIISMEGDEPVSVSLTVVGIIQPGDEYQDQSGSFAVATADDLFRKSTYISATGYTTAIMYGGDSASLKTSVKAMSEVTSKALKVETGAEYLESQKAAISSLLSVVTSFLLGFAAVALFVGALVIANTFSILVAQRARQLALLRCVGATRSQVFRTVLGEALLMGVVGGVVGLLLGAGFAFALVQISKAAKFSGLTAFAITPVAVILPLAIAILITLFAAVRPAFRATHVAPLAALQPQLEPVKGRHASLPVLVIGAILTVAGLAGLLYGALKPGWTSKTNGSYIMFGIIAGFASMVGFLMLGTIIVPALARLLGVIPARLGGVPGKLASENSRRNPKRATATASALLIGITLISMATVGAATANATEQRWMDGQFPSDLTATADGGITNSVLTRIQKNSVVKTAEIVGSAPVSINGGTKQETVMGMGPGTRSVLRYQEYLDGLADDTILVSQDSKIENGSTVTIAGDRGTVTLRAVLPKHSMGGLAISLSNLEKVSGTVVSEAWIMLKDTTNASKNIEAIASDLQDVPGIQVSGGVQIREQLQMILNIVLMVVIGLLAASVLVAIVGISNTLLLSVLERTRESALLRALGLTRPQLRGMFSMEALVLAGVGVVLGILLGIGYGIAGSFALMGKTISEIVVDIPWLYLLGILLFGLVAGYLASVLPSIRAGKVEPASALAAE